MEKDRKHIWRRQIKSLVDRIDNEHTLKELLSITAMVHYACSRGWPLCEMDFAEEMQKDGEA